MSAPERRHCAEISRRIVRHVELWLHRPVVSRECDERLAHRDIRLRGRHRPLDGIPVEEERHKPIMDGRRVARVRSRAVRVLELWRYPVKSLQGELVDSVAMTANGLEGDRRFAIYDVGTGLGLTGRRIPELLFASARWRDDGSVEISTQDGSLLPDDDALSAWLGRSVTLRSATSDGARQYENVIDF